MAGEIDLDRQITHRLSLDQVNEGFDLMRAGKSVRSVVTFE
jgi:S-(hydroxymethyl)glutathione dehydrogenase/alcohol dehydrogenase